MLSLTTSMGLVTGVALSGAGAVKQLSMLEPNRVPSFN